MNLLKIFKKPKFYLNYFLKSLKPYRVNINNKSFFVKYRPFWKSVNENRWERETYEIFDKFLTPENSYVDIGAWLGPTALYASQLAKHCYAIEPDPKSFKQLKSNLKLNPNLKSKITLFNHCLSNKNGKIKFGNRTSFGNSTSSILFGDQRTSTFVDCKTLERFFEDNKIIDCNFIKMDIEGGEALVLPSSKEFLKKHKPTLHLSLHPQFFTDCEKDCQNIIDSLSDYKNIFNSKGEKLNPENLLSQLISKKEGVDIVATDKD